MRSVRRSAGRRQQGLGSDMRVIDLHSDIQLDLARLGSDPTIRYRDSHLQDTLEGGIEIRVLATPSPPPHATAVAFRHIAAVHAAGLRVGTTVSDLDGEGPRYVLGLEGAEPFDDDLGLVETFYWSGVRVVGLTWMHPNAVSGACGGPDAEGLTRFGREVLREMERFPMILDLAHISDQGFSDAIATYEGPVMCSHTCSRRLRDHSRNITDEQLRLLAERDGVVGVCFYADFLDDDPGHRDVERVVDHIEACMDVVGEDRVGIGPDWCEYASDFVAGNMGPNWSSISTSTATPGGLKGVGSVEVTGAAEGLPDPSRLGALAEALNRRALPCEKILYDNAHAFLQRSLTAGAGTGDADLEESGGRRR